MKINYCKTGLAVTFTLFCATTCWAGPPAPPSIPSTPVGGAESSALTMIAIAAYGLWKSRK